MEISGPVVSLTAGSNGYLTQSVSVEGGSKNPLASNSPQDSDFSKGQETYYGYVQTLEDATAIIEACSLGLLPCVQRRLSEEEKSSIRSGSVFVWDPNASQIKRWTDGKKWDSSRVQENFMTYREICEADGLAKQFISMANSAGKNLSLVSYYSISRFGSANLQRPSTDPRLKPGSNLKNTNPIRALPDGERQQNAQWPTHPQPLFPRQDLGHMSHQPTTDNEIQPSAETNVPTMSPEQFPTILHDSNPDSGVVHSASNMAQPAYVMKSPMIGECGPKVTITASAPLSLDTLSFFDTSDKGLAYPRRSHNYGFHVPSSPYKPPAPPSTVWSPSAPKAHGNLSLYHGSKMWRAELTSSGAGREAFEPSGARNRTFLMPPPGAPTGIVNPCNLQSAAPSEPKQVLIFVRGDVGDSLQHVNGQPTPPANNLPPIVDGSLSVAGGDAINTGWSVDYYGHSTNRRGHGNGIGWRSQENEQVAGVWPRKYVCCICSLQWAVTPLSNTLFRNGVTKEDRKASQIPNPPDARRDPGFTRPQSSELHYYLDHKVTPDEPCVRGLCQTCRPVSLLPDGQPSRNCCPPQVANTNHLKEIYRCVMDNCPILTDRRANMKTHLSSHAHNDYLTELARRIKMGETLTAIDKQITYRLMHLFDNLDARGQKLINQPRSTVPLPEDISSPAVLREHTQWMFFLGLYAPEVHRRAFFDPETNQNYFRDYNLGEFGSVPGNLRIVSGATGRPVEASQFLWRQR